MSHYDNTGRCLYCDLVQAEVQDRVRVVLETERFVVLHPFASRVPFETWIMPTRHQPSFGQVSPGDLTALAQVLRATLRTLYNVVNEADLLAARAGKAAVEMSDLREAIDRLVAGLEKKNRVINPQEKEVVAFHEAGHALVAASLPGTDPVRKISIVPRGIAALGYTQQQPTEDRYLLRKSELYNRLCVLLGGRVAEELVFGDVSTGAHDDLRKVSDMARAMVTTYGMSDEVGLLTYDQPSSPFLPGIAPAPPKTYSEDTARQIDMEVRAIVDQAHAQVRQLLSEQKSALERLARRLLDHEVLEGAELHALLTPQPAPLAAACSPRAQGA